MPTNLRQYHQNAGAAEVSDDSAVLLALGRLQASVDHMQRDFAEEKRSATESRRAIYHRHDDLQGEIAEMKTDIAKSGHVVEQVREEVKQIGVKVANHKADIQPSIDDWKKIKALGLGVTGVLAIGGLSVGALLAMGWDAFKAALRSFLG